MEYSLEAWLGPILVGSQLSALLLGFVIIQVYQYFTASHKDRMWVKLLVLYLLGMETFASVLDIMLVWYYSITHFGDYTVFMKSSWLYSLVPTITGLISLPVQLFFARRVWILTRRLWFAALIAICSVLILLSFIGITVSNTVVEEFTFRYPTGTKVLSTVGLSLHIFVDIMITGNLVGYLRTHRSGLSRSDAVITDIIRLTMQTGTVTVVVVIVVFILAEIDSFRFVDDNASAVFYLPLSKLYTLSLLVNLNARQTWNFPESVMWDSNQFGSRPTPGDGVIASQISISPPPQTQSLHRLRSSGSIAGAEHSNTKAP